LERVGSAPGQQKLSFGWKPLSPPVPLSPSPSEPDASRSQVVVSGLVPEPEAVEKKKTVHTQGSRGGKSRPRTVKAKAAVVAAVATPQRGLEEDAWDDVCRELDSALFGERDGGSGGVFVADTVVDSEPEDVPARQPSPPSPEDEGEHGEAGEKTTTGEADDEGEHDEAGEKLTQGEADDEGKAGGEPSQGEFAAAPPELSDIPTCRRCLQPATVDIHRIMAKSTAKWVCNRCNTRGVQLSRIYGAWPPKSFKDLPAEAQAEFWNKVKDAQGEAEMKKAVSGTMSLVKIEQEESQAGGEYLPLSVWVARGFLKEDVLKCTDTQEHAYLGKTYRITINSKYSKNIEQFIRQEVQESKRKKKEKEDEAEGAPPTKKREMGSEATLGSGSCVHASAEGGAMPTLTAGGNPEAKQQAKDAKASQRQRAKEELAVQRRRAKEDAEIQREREKQDREKKRKEQQQAAALLTFASRCLGKAVPIISLIEADLADPISHVVPGFVRDPLVTTKLDLQQKANDCKQITSGASSLKELKWDQTAFNQLVKKASEQRALHESMAQTARKLGQTGR